MGQESVKAITEAPDLDLVAQTDLGDNLSETIKKTRAQVVVDFTTAAVVMENAAAIIESGARPVIGTSGLLPEQISRLQELCKKNNNGGLIAPNFAIGALLMMKYAQDAAKYFPNVEIIELHHDLKADAPSGTAIKTSNLLSESRKSVQKKINEKEILLGAREALRPLRHPNKAQALGRCSFRELQKRLEAALCICPYRRGLWRRGLRLAPDWEEETPQNAEDRCQFSGRLDRDRENYRPGYRGP